MPYRYTLIIAAVFCSITVWSQGGTNSPFSLFGIGNLSDQGYMHLRQMAGVTTGYYDTYQLNFDNPASLSYLRSTAFDLGLEAQNSKIKDNHTNSSLWSGNLGYIGLGFATRNPVNDIFENDTRDFSWGMGINLAPISSINYNIAQRDSLPEVGGIERRYIGEGGFYKVSWANGFKYKNLAAGINLGYVFGREKYDRIVDFVDQSSAFDNSFSSTYTARGFYWDVGLLYTVYLDAPQTGNGSQAQDRSYLTIGLTAKPRANLRTEAEELNINFFAPTSQDFLVDTINYSPAAQGTGVLPSEFGIGLSYNHKNKLMVSMDLRSSQWSQYRNDAKPETLVNTTRLAVGGYYCPNYKSINSFWKRVQYRAGVYLDQDARQVSGKRIDNYGVTFGVGLPFAWQRKFSNLNVGLDIRRRAVDDVLSETIYKLNFGFTFNDNEWFIKRKYN